MDMSRKDARPTPAMRRLINRTDFQEYEDGSRRLDNFNIPAQQPFDTEDMEGTLQAILARNVGQYVVVEFLLGTEQLTRKQGILFLVGRNYVTLYDEAVNNFLVCDLFAVKFVYFYMPGARPPYNYNLLPPAPGEGPRPPRRR